MVPSLRGVCVARSPGKTKGRQEGLLSVQEVPDGGPQAAQVGMTESFWYTPLCVSPRHRSLAIWFCFVGSLGLVSSLDSFPWCLAAQGCIKQLDGVFWAGMRDRDQGCKTISLSSK